MSDAEVAEVPFTAFTSKPDAKQMIGRLIVRRVRDANPDHVIANEQGELFPDLAAPRGVHRLAAADGRRRGRPPPPRGHRTAAVPERGQVNDVSRQLASQSRPLCGTQLQADAPQRSWQHNDFG